MSGMVMVRTRKLCTCLQGKPRWIIGWQQRSAGTRKLFLAFIYLDLGSSHQSPRGCHVGGHEDMMWSI